LINSSWLYPDRDTAFLFLEEEVATKKKTTEVIELGTMVDVELRDTLAMAALSGLCASRQQHALVSIGAQAKDLAEAAWEIADAMLIARTRIRGTEVKLNKNKGNV
jgi:hypothetical protein